MDLENVTVVLDDTSTSTRVTVDFANVDVDILGPERDAVDGGGDLFGDAVWVAADIVEDLVLERAVAEDSVAEEKGATGWAAMGGHVIRAESISNR